MQVSPNQTVGMRSLTIDYGTGDSSSPGKIHRLTQKDIHKLGIDETGDGRIDRSAKFAIQNIRTNTDGRVTLTFDRPVTVSENNTLLGVYEVQNPDILGSQAVTTTLTGEATTYRKSGTVLYGPAGQGTLGYGVDLRLETSADESLPTAPLSALDVAYDTSTSELVVNTDTTVLATGMYGLRLHTEDSTPEDLPEVDITERFKIVKPDADITNHSIDSESQLSVNASTNLAPENTVIIRIDAQEAGGGISQVQNCVATVQPDKSISCGFDLSESGSDLNVEASIRQNDTIIAGPTRLN